MIDVDVPNPYNKESVLLDVLDHPNNRPVHTYSIG